MKVLRHVKQGRWLEPVPPGSALAPGDALLDLPTDRNELSVWLVADDQSNLEVVIAAIACGRQFLSNVDYVAADLHTIEGLGLTMVERPGTTPHDAANVWHRDLSMLSASDVAGLANALFRDGPKRITKKGVAEMLVEGVRNNSIDIGSLDPTLRDQLETQESGA